MVMLCYVRQVAVRSLPSPVPLYRRTGLLERYNVLFSSSAVRYLSIIGIEEDGDKWINVYQSVVLACPWCCEKKDCADILG